MYSLTGDQIDFINSDIAKRGIEMESLRNDLLDHVCCIIEEEYDGKSDFAEFYIRVIKRFYKSELKEIQEETILHLTFKNYYVMKKTMIYSGAFTAFTLIMGSFFKVMHYPGAGILFALAILTASLLFLPLNFLLKSKEEPKMLDKFIIGSGFFAFMLFSLGVLFRIQHWQGAMYLWMTSLVITFIIFIPMYFVSGIRRPEKKTNTTVFTVIIILAAGLQFALINVHPAKRELQMKMYGYLQNEEILNRLLENHSASSTKISEPALGIYSTCSELKKKILKNNAGLEMLPADFEKQNILLEEGNLGNDFAINGAGSNLIKKLQETIIAFNSNVDEKHRLPFKNTILDADMGRLYSYSNYFVLNNLSQLQMVILLNNN
jgi:hypothetical protein